MLLRIGLWSMLLGSVVMGFFGWQTGSATTTVVGIVTFVIAAFALFFLAKLVIHVGITIVKIVFIGSLLILLGWGLYQGGLFLFKSGQHFKNTAENKITSWESSLEHASFSEKLIRFFKGNTEGDLPQDLDKQPNHTPSSLMQETVEPQEISTISGVVSEVKTGYLFRINDHFIKLFGIDAPDLTQTCIDKRHQKYDCGHQAKTRLERLILGKKVDCQILITTSHADYIAVCTLDDYDIGATMISVGWAVTNRALTDVYIPYEDMAHQQNLGLWEGQFVAPWEFRLQRAAWQQHQQKASPSWKDWF